MVKRKCVGCNQIKDVDELLKLTHDSTTGQVVINKNNKIFGRSAYLCYNTSCIEAAFKKNKISKVLKTQVSEDMKGKLTDEF